MSVLVIAEHENNSVKPEFTKVLRAAWDVTQNRENDVTKDIHVALIGTVDEALIQYVANVPHVSKVWVLEGVNHAFESLQQVSAGIAQLVQCEGANSAQANHGFSHVICATTPLSKALMPNIAAQLDVDQISNVSSIESDDTYLRPIYAGRLLNRVQSHNAIKLLTIVPSAFEALDNTPSVKSALESKTAQIEKRSLNSQSGDALTPAQILRVSKTESERPPLQSAKIVVSVGRGLIKSKDDIAKVEAFADSIGAAIGATRAVVDAGWMPNDKQIGQTAKIVSPDLYIALGISGAAQHLAGMKNSKVIIAVNKDENAPIFNVAHYGLIGDLNEVMPQLQALLSAQ